MFSGQCMHVLLRLMFDERDVVTAMAFFARGPSSKPGTDCMFSNRDVGGMEDEKTSSSSCSMDAANVRSNVIVLIINNRRCCDKSCDNTLPNQVIVR